MWHPWQARCDPDFNRLVRLGSGKVQQHMTSPFSSQVAPGSSAMAVDVGKSSTGEGLPTAVQAVSSRKDIKDKAKQGTGTHIITVKLPDNSTLDVSMQHQMALVRAWPHACCTHVLRHGTIDSSGGRMARHRNGQVPPLYDVRVQSASCRWPIVQLKRQMLCDALHADHR